MFMCFLVSFSYFNGATSPLGGTKGTLHCHVKNVKPSGNMAMIPPRVLLFCTLFVLLKQFSIPIILLKRL